MSEKTAGACFATWPTFMVLLVYKTQTKINFKTGISKIMRQFLLRARSFRMHMKNPSRPSRSERAKDVVLCTLPSPLRQTKENGNLAVPKGYEAMHVHNRQLFYMAVRTKRFINSECISSLSILTDALSGCPQQSGTGEPYRKNGCEITFFI